MEWDEKAGEDLEILDAAPTLDEEKLGVDLNILVIDINGPKKIVKSFIDYSNEYKGYGKSGTYHAAQVLNNDIISDTIREVHKKYGGFNYIQEKIVIDISRNLPCKNAECKLGLVRSNNGTLFRCKCMGIKIWKKNKPHARKSK